MDNAVTEPAFLPDQYSPRFTRTFSWWSTEKMIAKRFHAVRLSTDSDEPGTRGLGAHAGPVIAVINHASWWDPLVMLMLQRELLGGRTIRAPMDITQLRKFAMFRRLGAFGIDPDDPSSLGAMERHVLAYFERDLGAGERPTLWVTPQGRFADVRAKLVVRPGAAAIAARAGALGAGVRVLAVNVEYAFWIDQKPELFLDIAPVPTPAPAAGATPDPREDGSISTTAWHRAITASMRAGQARLADRVIARDPSGFATLRGAGAGSVNPLYDLWVRLRGHRAEITLDARAGGAGRGAGEQTRGAEGSR